MENYPQPLSSSRSSDSNFSPVQDRLRQQRHNSNNSNSNGGNIVKTNMLFQYLSEKIGDAAARHIQDVCDAKSRRLEVEIGSLKARNANLEAENARLKSQMEMKDAIISNANMKSVSPRGAAPACPSVNGDTKVKKEKSADLGSTKNIEAKLAKLQENFDKLLHASNAKHDAMESKIVKSTMEIASLKNTIAAVEPKEILNDVDEIYRMVETNREDINALIERMAFLEHNLSANGSKPVPPPRASLDDE